MAFTDKQKALLSARRQREKAQRDLFIAKEKLGRTRREKQRLTRFTAAGQSGIDARIGELKEREGALNRQVDALNTALEQGKALEADNLEAFLTFSDPRENLGRLNDAYPILLLPLRLETRFKKIEQPGAAARDQLWVRVFPDDIAVDTFEELLSENEVRNARSYWKSIWRAGGIEADKRAAWRILVTNHGSGRARWIEQHYRPVNESDLPEKEGAEEIILVIATDLPPTEEELGSIKTFWQAYWRAGEDKERRQSARDALVSELGEERAQVILRDYVPFNLSDTPAGGLSRDEVSVQVSLLIFPDEDSLNTKFQSWAKAPTVNLMPERLVLLGFADGREEPVLQALGAPIPSALAAGPDPGAPEGQQMRIEDGELVISEELKWMVDFDQALAKGMGFKVDLTTEQAENGFDRLFVLGLRLSEDHTAGKQSLENLIQHHQASRKGFSLLPQGTPTNNTEKQKSGYSWREDPDQSFDLYFKQEGRNDPRGWFDKKDGRWLAELLGIDAGAVSDISFYHCTDQREAKAMNIALWPATLGYFMQTMMAPVFNDEVIEQTRNFFNNFVSGRGMIPAVRVGKQPYGILPATTFSRMRWLRPRIPITHLAEAEAGFGSHFSFLQALYAVLMRIDQEWSVLLEKVGHVGKSGDAHQILLDVVGLHPASVEFYNRYAQSFDQLYNSLNLKGLGGALAALVIAAGYVQSGLDLLKRFGYEAESDEAVPDILRKFFLGRSDLLKGPLIDDVPLSETDPVRAYTEAGDNYIQWLIRAANQSHDALRKQQGFIDSQPPSALLYLMLHHSLDLGYIDTSLHLHESAGVLGREEVLAARREPDFIHIQEGAQDRGSRWQYLYKSQAQITEQPDLLISDYIPRVIDSLPHALTLRQQLRSLEYLKDVSTAGLERAFVEHLDTCSYRLDAWLLGLVQYQLALMRNLPFEKEESTPKQGVYIGAYGWLEKVRPEGKVLTPARPGPELEEIFADPDHPLLADNTNMGYIHAPSINHAVTAAILRNGYLADAAPDNPDTLAVNLSSERVRLALSMIEGMRSGQSLSALLGYQLERGLHDRHDVEVDAFIFDLRKAFPLNANRLASTRTDEFDSIDQIEARNVVDALELIQQIKTSGIKNYPFGRGDLPEAGAAQKTAIDQEVTRIMDINDAVADLAMAESVHQIVQGNYDRAAATLDTYSKGHFPPTPDVIKTPRSGITLTHRVGLHLESGLDPAAAENVTVRSKAEPAINKWLYEVMPAMADIVCRVDYYNHSTESTETKTISMADLGLLPIDLLYTATLEDEQAMSKLDDAIVWYVIQTFSPRPDAAVNIHYTKQVEGKFTLFELAPLLDGLRALITRSRPLSAADVKPAAEASQADEADVDLHPLRITLVRDELSALKSQLETFISSLEIPVNSQDKTALMAGLDNYIADLAALFRAAATFGLPQTGTGFMLSWRRRQFSLLMEKIKDLITRWTDRLARFDALISDFDALPADTETKDQFNLLVKAERLISANLSTPSGSADDFRSHLVNNKRPPFQSKLSQVEAVLSKTTLSGLLLDTETAAADIDDYDLEGLSLEEEKRQLLIFARDLLTGARNLHHDMEKGLTEVGTQLQAANEAGEAMTRVNSLLAAAEAMLGQDFRLVPEFGLEELQGNEWQNGFDNRNQLLSYQLNELQEPFPVDTWLHGIARVREKMRELENTCLIVEAFTDKELVLEPLQFPYHEEDYWLALEYPDKTSGGEPFVIDEDKLLYTAYYKDSFDKTKKQCGLLLDEWTEVIPTPQETSGMCFHYDRPNCEPPQTLLLVTPSDFKGQWQWQDLVDTLQETLDLAKKRAIEPTHIDDTALGRFLPALISTVTVYPITAALNLALNNKFYTLRTG